MATPTPTPPYPPWPASRRCPAPDLASPSGFWKILALMNSRSSGLGAAASPEPCKGKSMRTAKNRSCEGDTPARPVTYSPRTRRRTGPCCFRCCPGGVPQRGWSEPPGARPLPFPHSAVTQLQFSPPGKADRAGGEGAEGGREGPKGRGGMCIVRNEGAGQGDMEREAIKGAPWKAGGRSKKRRLITLNITSSLP